MKMLSTSGKPRAVFVLLWSGWASGRANGTRKPAADDEVRVPELQVSGPGDGDHRVEVEEEQTE